MVDPTAAIASALPSRLRPGEQSALFARLVALRNGGEWYAEIPPDEDPLQGDGWGGVDFVVLETLKRKSIRTVILTNSCDNSSENERAYPLNLIICPLIRMSRYEGMLRGLGRDDQWISSHFASVRNQDITNIFFLPQGGNLEEDSLIRFDHVQSQSPDEFRASEKRVRLFTLSQQAFWLFLVKLSTHFCRIGEGIERS